MVLLSTRRRVKGSNRMPEWRRMASSQVDEEIVLSAVDDVCVSTLGRPIEELIWNFEDGICW